MHAELIATLLNAPYNFTEGLPFTVADILDTTGASREKRRQEQRSRKLEALRFSPMNIRMADVPEFIVDLARSQGKAN